MDLTQTLEDLRRQKENLKRVIAYLEELQASVTLAPPQKKRRGRKLVSLLDTWLLAIRSRSSEYNHQVCKVCYLQ